MASAARAGGGTHTVTATEARVHFGEMIRIVRDQGGTVIVERAGEPEAAIISMDDLRELRRHKPQSNAGPRTIGERFLAMREEILAEMGDRTLGDVDELIDYGQR